MSNDVCPAGLSWAFNNKFRILLHNPKKILGSYVKNGYTVADIGCGPGFFSLALAEMVGKEGRVIAVDLQKKMLDKVEVAAEHRNLLTRIKLHQCTENSLALGEKVDFALAFWMVHEVPDAQSLFTEIATILKPDGLFLLVEPKVHTDYAMFRDEIGQACRSGLRPYQEIKVGISRAMLFSLASQDC